MCLLVIAFQEIGFRVVGLLGSRRWGSARLSPQRLVRCPESDTTMLPRGNHQADTVADALAAAITTPAPLAKLLTWSTV